jgi:hypothetical protein
MPLRPRCEYAAAFPRSLPGGSCLPPRKFPARHEGRVRAAPGPDPPGFRAGAASRGCHTPVPRVLLSVSLAGPVPSGSSGTSRLCQGCSRRPRHHPDRAALSSAVPLRRDQRSRSLTSTRITAPHGAHTMPVTPRRRCCWSRASTSVWCSRYSDTHSSARRSATPTSRTRSRRTPPRGWSRRYGDEHAVTER